MKTSKLILIDILCCIAFLTLVGGVALAAGSTFTFSGEISDVEGAVVSGAEVSFYKTSNVKRPADFVSNRTGAEGKYQVVLPEGVYWAFATLRRDGRKFGPLGLEDKHSGTPVEVEIGPDEELLMDFVVMDLREATKKIQKKNDTLVRVSGRILDQKGSPVVMAYAMADTVKRFKEIPRYLSAWTDETGQYLLFLPKGRYYLGVLTGFPPDADYSLTQELLVDDDRSGLDVILSDELVKSRDVAPR
nr:carboxypeptidase regulatory-like domain-containing protein [Desulfobulbaceae bacterium]